MKLALSSTKNSDSKIAEALTLFAKANSQNQAALSERTSALAINICHLFCVESDNCEKIIFSWNGNKAN